MKTKKKAKIYKNYFFISMLISIILAVFMSIYFPKFINKTAFIGSIYINLLKLMIIPIIFTTITTTIYNGKRGKNKLFIKAILLFIIMFIASFVLTTFVLSFFKINSSFAFEHISSNLQISNLDYANVILNLFPSNIVDLFQSGSVFGTIIFAVVFGFAALKVESGSSVIKLIEILKNIFYKILEYIMYFTPFGVFSLFGMMFVNNRLSIFKIGFEYVLLAYLCGTLVLFFVMYIPLLVVKKMSFIAYLKNITSLWLMTITTCSSVACLPFTAHICKDKFKLSEENVNMIVPLGCTINMCGGAVSFALLSIFCSRVFNIDITLSKYFIMLFLALIINMSAPGIPSGGVVLGATYLTILGIPLEFIGFYSSIYKLLDMAYTTINVTGDVTCSVLLDNKS